MQKVSCWFSLFFAAMLSSLVAAAPASARTVKSSVALVIDQATEASVRPSLQRYADAIRADGKQVIVLAVPSSVDPGVIRDTLCYLHANARLEGAVLIGEIPVPMIRRAHHLATAFKMNPAIRRDRSSIPSDRFYDDFSLKFDFIDREGALCYYDLSPEGAQRVECDIYTARIKPATTDPEHPAVALVAEFLDRAAAAHGRPEPIDHLFHFGGHGNSSESFNARIDENRAYAEMFGLEGPAERVDYLNFDEDRFVRERLQKVLAQEDIDICHLHTHGAVDMQYLSKEPYASMASDQIQSARRFFRGKMRSASDKEKTRAYLLSQYDIPASWLEDYDDPALAEADSIRSAAVDISLADLEGFRSGSKLLILDACFNGAFQNDDYVAARYAFAHGSHSLAVTANSVNIIQDHWKAEMMGLLDQGVCIGNWHKQVQTLESHLFGDPTWVFSGRPSALDAVLAFPSLKSVRKLLGSEDPSVCGFAIRYLYRAGALSSAELSRYLEADPRMNVRMEALTTRARYPKDYPALVHDLAVALRDPYEMIRRMASKYVEICVDPSLEAEVDRALADPLLTSRVRFHLMTAKASYGEDAAKTASEIGDLSLSIKDRGFAVNAQRNRCTPAAAGPMIDLIKDPLADKSLRLKAAEALGWYVLSVKRDAIYAAASAQAAVETDPEVRDELKRTVARLEDNAYCR